MLEVLFIVGYLVIALMITAQARVQCKLGWTGCSIIGVLWPITVPLGLLLNMLLCSLLVVLDFLRK